MSLAGNHSMAEALLLTAPEKRQKIRWRNLAVGSLMNIFQVTSLGQPLEVLKTHVAANRRDTLSDAVRQTWSRGRFAAFYQGLIPWAWLEASTKGAILILTSTEVEAWSKSVLSASPATAGALGGIAGGAAQAYLTMGMTTCMKTVEVTRTKAVASGARVVGPIEIFFQILRTQGIRGVNKGVNAVALRQITGWSSRIGIARFAETQIRQVQGINPDQKLSMGNKIVASTIGGALSCWNQPFEVLRVEMQSLKVDPNRPSHLTMYSTLKHILRESGIKGLFRGVIPRIGVAAWATICMVGLGDKVKEMANGNPTNNHGAKTCIQ